jgi:universal stress protein E
MGEVHKILVIVDPTAAEQPAVEKGAALAQRFNARLELFACETKESRAMRYAAHLANGGNAAFVSHVRTFVEALAVPLRSRGIDVAVEATSGDPLHTKLLERVQGSQADLVVKDTHHHSLAKRTFITNTDWHLIRGCAAPLLFTKPKPWAGSPVIAAAVDPGHVNDKPVVLDHRILEWAQTLERRLSGRLDVVHAYLPAVLMAEAATGMPSMMVSLTPETMEEERKRELAKLEAIVAPYGVTSPHVSVQLGTASEVLPRFAQEVAADVLVMGAISRSGLKRIFIGSTAERVLEHLPCDVFIVKPPDFAAAQ